MGRKKKETNNVGSSAHALEPRVQIPAVISREHRERIHMFLLDENALSLSFPPTLNNIERKAIHQYARDAGMKSKSHGEGIVIVQILCFSTHTAY